MAEATLIPIADAAQAYPPGLRLPEDWSALDPVRERLQGAARSWLIARGADVAGICAFMDAPEDQRPEIGYGTAPSFRGQGMAQHAVRLMQAEANTSGCAGLRAQTLAANPASGRVLESRGFTQDGRRDDAGMGAVLAWRWDVA